MDINFLHVHLYKHCYLLHHQLLVQLHNQVVQMSGDGQLNYIATGSSILQSLPKITVIDHTGDKCENLFAQVYTIHTVTLVHGKEGVLMYMIPSHAGTYKFV